MLSLDSKATSMLIPCISQQLSDCQFDQTRKKAEKCMAFNTSHYNFRFSKIRTKKANLSSEQIETTCSQNKLKLHGFFQLEPAR